jgi:hypothetical protein
MGVCSLLAPNLLSWRSPRRKSMEIRRSCRDYQPILDLKTHMEMQSKSSSENWRSERVVWLL